MIRFRLCSGCSPFSWSSPRSWSWTPAWRLSWTVEPTSVRFYHFKSSNTVSPVIRVISKLVKSKKLELDASLKAKQNRGAQFYTDFFILNRLIRLFLCSGWSPSWSSRRSWSWTPAWRLSRTVEPNPAGGSLDRWEFAHSLLVQSVIIL